jgi:hypothetical protein
MVGDSGNATPDFEKSQRHALTNCRRYGFSVDAMAYEIGISDGQSLAIAITGMTGEFDVNPVKYPARR